MNLWCPLPSNLAELALLNPWYRLDETVREKLVLLAVFGGLTLVLLLWALFIRKRRPRRAHYDLSAGSSSSRGRSAEANGASSRRRKWRRRRRDHRPRNPTLAETGGLPPLRTQEPPETAF